MLGLVGSVDTLRRVKREHAHADVRASSVLWLPLVQEDPKKQHTSQVLGFVLVGYLHHHGGSTDAALMSE